MSSRGLLAAVAALSPIVTVVDGVAAVVTSEFGSISDIWLQEMGVIANLGDTPVQAQALSLDAGPLCGGLSASVVHGIGAAAPPVVGPTGGFDGYVPIPDLGPQEGVVIELAG